MQRSEHRAGSEDSLPTPCPSAIPRRSAVAGPPLRLPHRRAWRRCRPWRERGPSWCRRRPCLRSSRRRCQHRPCRQRTVASPYPWRSATSVQRAAEKQRGRTAWPDARAQCKINSKAPGACPHAPLPLGAEGPQRSWIGEGLFFCLCRLLGQAFVEGFFEARDVLIECPWIDKGVRSAAGKFGPLSLHAVHFGVGCQKYLRLGGASPGKRLAVVVDDAGIGRIGHEFVERDGGTAEDDGRPRLIAILYAKGPARAPGGMARSVVRGDGDAAQRYRITILDGAIDARGRELQLGGTFLARVVATLDERLVALTHHELGAAFLLEFGKSTGVIEVGLRI